VLRALARLGSFASLALDDRGHVLGGHPVEVEVHLGRALQPGLRGAESGSAAGQAYERACATAGRLTRRVRELSGHLDRAQFSAWRAFCAWLAAPTRAG
jgi:hypothetical protein